MDGYTIYCTPEQVRKAIGLGAPIATKGWFGFKQLVDVTSKRMMEWILEQNIHFKIRDFDGNVSWVCWSMSWCVCGYSNNYKEAALSVIDAALEYLTNNKK